MVLPFHLQNNGREVFFVSFIQSSSVDLKSRVCRRHSCCYGCCKAEDQPKILVHQAEWKLRGEIAIHGFLQFSNVGGSNDRGLGENRKQLIALQTSLLAECNRLGNRLHPD